MTRIDIELDCPYCRGIDAEHPDGRTFHRMISIGLDLDLTVPRKLKSKNVCTFCKRELPVNVKIRANEPCCDKPLIKGHYDKIPLRRHERRLLHRTCANCEKQISIIETVEVVK